MVDKDKPTTEPSEAVEEKGGKDEKLFTQEDVNKLVGKTKVELKSDFEKRLEEALAKEREEAEKMAKLSAEEKEKELLEKAKGELSAREQEVTLKENRLTAQGKLMEAGIPTDLSEFVIDVDTDKQEERISTLIENWNTAIQKTVEDKLKGKTPKDIQPSPSKERPKTMVL